MYETNNINQDLNETVDFFAALTEPNYYQILNVSQNATRVEIREAYLRMKNSIANNQSAFYSIEDTASAERMLADLEKAFFVLENDQERARYDQRLHPQSAAPANEMDPFAGLIVEDKAKAVSPIQKKPIERKPINAPIDTDIKTQIADLLQSEQSGEALKKARELVGLSLSEVHEVVRIPIDILAALENEDFSFLPSTVYVRGFLVNYLRFLNYLEPKVFVAPYIGRYEAWKNQ